MILHVVITNVVYFLVVTSQEFISGYLYFYKIHFYFCKQEMRYCSEDALRTGGRTVNLNKNTSENAALNKKLFCAVFSNKC